MDSSSYLSLPGVFVSSILNNLLSNSWTEILNVVIRGLLRFMQANKYMEDLSLNNKYLPFIGKW